MNSRVFLSYSTRRSELKNFIEKLLKEVGLTPEVFDYPTPISQFDEQVRKIDECAALVALVTREENGSLNQNVMDEIAIAHTKNKPVQCILFDGIKSDDLTASRSRIVAEVKNSSTSTGEALMFGSSDIVKIVSALIKLKSSILDDQPTYSFFYKSFAIEQEILSRGELRLKNHIKAVTREPLDTHTHEGTLFCRGKTEAGVKLIEGDNFQFIPIRPTQTSTTIRMQDNRKEFFRFLIDYNPPLKEEDDLEYAYIRKYENFFPFTYEEMEDAFNNKLISHAQMKQERMIGQDFIVTRPTDHLSISLLFPPGYPIDQKHVKALACEGKTDGLNFSETARAQECLSVSYDPVHEQYRLTLELGYPRPQCSFFLRYRPPNESQIKTDTVIRL